MERAQALHKLRALEGRDLHELRRRHFRDEVTFKTAEGRINKGWAGQVIERYLGIQLNSSRAPNMGTWELKVIPLKYLLNGELRFKETMAITMIDAPYIRQTPFERSHLLDKMRKAVIVARIVGSSPEDPQIVHSATATGLDDDRDLYRQVQRDYNLVRECIADPARGPDALRSDMGTYVQPRTKGAGGNAKRTRAFYARKEFLARVIHLGNRAAGRGGGPA